MKNVYIIGGGTTVDVRPHFSLCAKAYGSLARGIAARMVADGNRRHLLLSKMAGGNAFDTNKDLSVLLDKIVATPGPAIVFMTAAVCDWDVSSIDVHGAHSFQVGNQYPRLSTRGGVGNVNLALWPSEKLVRKIRKDGGRKDIFLVACKTTTGATDDEMFKAGLTLLKDASCNLVLVNDIHRRHNMIVTPEQARYGVDCDRDAIIDLLVEMTYARSQGTFTRSTVIPGAPVPWQDSRVFPTLRKVVDHCIEQGAYKDILGRGATVGHFAVKLGPDRFLTSRRNSDFNKMADVGLVEVEASSSDASVIARGFKPSVGGQSQRIIFREHPDADCIVHFHCPPQPQASLPTKSQKDNECGSHQCGQNTSDGLVEVEPGIKVVYLDHHGPNIVFNHDIDPEQVIRFINRNFDLSRHTGDDGSAYHRWD